MTTTYIRKLSHIIITCSLMLLLSICIACGEKTEKEQGALPILKAGDTWVTQSTSEGTDYTLTYVVTGEEVVDGIECYVIELTNDPPFMGINKSIAKMDKTTLDPIQGQLEGEIQGGSFVGDMVYSYTYSNEQYPLKIGNTWDVTETLTTTFTFMDETETETEQNIYTYEVEKIEEITVPAGTFSCFKILQYNDSDSLLSTSWVSDKTKYFNVKEIDNESGDTSELISYSVSD